MKSASSGIPPFSPALLIGLWVKPLPLPPLNFILAKMMRHMHRQHGAVFERIQTVQHPCYLIVPTDLPFAFQLDARLPAPTLTAVNRASRAGEAATIRGPISALIALLEGGIDGDSLFFTRDLTIDGDTEAVLALRNAVDGTEIDLRADLQRLAGPLAAYLPALLEKPVAALWRHISQDFNTVHQALTAPLERKIAQQAHILETLEQDVKSLNKTVLRKRRAQEQTA